MTIQIQTSRRNVSVNTGDASFATDTFNLVDPVAGQARPRILAEKQRKGEVFSLDLQGLSPSSIEWFADDTATGQTGTNFIVETASRVFARIIADGATYDTPPVAILSSNDHLGHNNADDAVVALIPHQDATHIAVADGAWTNPAIWDVGIVPRAGDVVLVPIGVTVTYDSTIAPRLDRLRVDGTLTWALDQTTRMLVETMIVLPGGKIVMGDAVTNRLPAQHTAEIIISNRAYRINPDTPTNLDLAHDPMLMSRGIVVLGEWTAFGTKRETFVVTAAQNLPQAGDTSVVLDHVPENWQIGDRIVIPGTAIDVDETGFNHRYDEYRRITGISGVTVFWDLTQPLIHNHDHHNPNVAERDVFRLPIVNQERNVTVRSEPGAAVHQRGHTMAMHYASHLDIWDVAFLEMGRTDKSIPAGVIENGEFLYAVPNVKDTRVTEPLTAASNLQSRYPIHGHFMGFKKAKTPLVQNCYVEDAKAWAGVHHGCEMDWLGNVFHRFQGAGLVAETGNELGRWDNNVTFGVDTVCGSSRFPKGANQNEGLEGDFFRQGYGFAYRGRAMITTRNIAVGTTWGHVFYHRGGGLTPEFDKIDLLRVNIDVNDLYLANGADDVFVANYPITHFDQNQTIGAYGSFAVIKAGTAQNHDLNIRITNMVSWGLQQGTGIEYIGAYLVRNFLNVYSRFAARVPYATNKAGFDMTKTNNVTFRNIEAVDFPIGIRFTGAVNQGVSNADFNNTDNPRFILGEHSFPLCRTPIVYDVDYNGVDAQDVTKVMPLPIVEVERPTVDIPFIVGGYDRTARVFTSYSAGATKSDTGSPALPIPRPWDDLGLFFASNDNPALLNAASKYGLWEYTDDQNVVRNILLLPAYFGDIVTGRFIKKMLALEWLVLADRHPNNGPFVRSDTDPVCDHVTRIVTTGQLDSFNVLDGATGAPGTTLSLNIPELVAGLGTDTPAHFKANYGKITVDKAGLVTYRSVPNFVGKDTMSVNVYDGMGRFCTVDITYDVRAP